MTEADCTELIKLIVFGSIASQVIIAVVFCYLWGEG